MLPWPCAVHKVQGLSLPKIAVSFDLHRQGNFNYGQIYVALSRVTSLEGLYITGSVSAAVIKANPQAMEEYNRMRLERALMVDEVKEPNSNVLVIVLLNIRSLSKHVLDLKCDQRLKKSDILCLTETQVLTTSTTVAVSELPEFNIGHNSCYDRFQSIATCLKQSSVHLVCHETMTGASYVEYVKSSFSHRVIKMLVIYKERANSLTQFCDWVGEFVRTRHVEIILGDFNINVLGKPVAALS